MVSNAIKVAVYGAAGESAGLIVDQLLASTTPCFEVTALVQPSSISKPAYAKLAQRGVKVVAINLNGPDVEAARVLEGQDVVVASVPPNALDSQLPLIRASKLANINRFIPTAFAMALDPNGISTVQPMKEKIYQELEACRIPYTVIDVGWWYNGFIPDVPSGKTDHAIALPDFLRNLVPGDGNMKTYVIDNEDVGKFVTRIIVDPRTVNKRVMAAGASMSFNEMFAIAEELTGDIVTRKHVSAEEVKSMIDGAATQVQSDPSNYLLLVGKLWLEYYYSSFIDGDNSPEGANRLGYIMAGDLYPDFKSTTFRGFFQETLDGKRRIPYSAK
ncbi:isoflavone reductase [Colletotrichum gloeosporioides Cg-14]|uniref:Isoflavone reductase n=1 Tax=Colletotrichum gloeosporioides (strain Cg-14) TaxID=1237896 RepID=T0LK78_COLGC|nr:isoflavone reductase [Colletotrichum gloeosporioides Cg-14]